MKKSLVLAMAMALGVTASAYAANPFSDVPAGHWAYDSINKLAAAGVIDGYGDGTFGGDKLMTRYEMAQIVAKAMAKGASVERLAAEFADELENLGVRVANLEKKADNVKITGELRFRYVDQDGAMYKKIVPAGDGVSGVLGNDSNHAADIRSRIWINGMINDDWTYTGMLQNTQNLSDNAGNEDTKFQRAYVDGKLGGMAVRAGRYNLVIADGNIYDTRADGLELSYGSKLKLKGFAGKATDDITVVPYMHIQRMPEEKTLSTGDITNGGKYWGLALEGELAKGLKATAGYTQFKDMGTETAEKTDIDNGIWHAGMSYDIGHFNLSAMYLKGDLSADKSNNIGNIDINNAIDQYLDDDGFVIGLSYKGAKAEDAGSWGAWAKYYDQGAQTYVAHTTDANTFGMTGFKGFGVGANYTLAKNIVANVAYYNTESKLLKELPGIAADFDRTKDHRFWTDVTFTF